VITSLLQRVDLRRERGLFPGVMACSIVAVAATFLADHYGAPVMLFALLLGIAMNFLSTEGDCVAGIAFTASTVLRVGIALLGLRVTFEQVQDLGWEPVAGVVLCVGLTIGVSVVAAKRLGFRSTFGMLSGGATAICGASAALALAATLPPSPHRDKATSFTIIGVSVLSTVAMVLYPMIARAMGLDPIAAGLFLGGTIHDVAQVVGAGYSMSKETGDTATVVKLMRVAMLLPVIMLAAAMPRASVATHVKKPPLLPWFAVAFAALVALNSTGWVARELSDTGSLLSRWCLVAAMAAIGMKTQIRELATIGLRPVLLLLGETVFLASLVLLLLRWSA